MTKQEVFDKVAEHLLTQNAKATEGGFCRYKTKSGLKCAVGCLIPDGHPAQSCGGGLSVLLREQRLEDETLRVLVEHQSMLIRLQSIHDTGEPCNWRIRLREYALASHLSTAVLD